VDTEPGDRFVLEAINDIDMSMDLGPLGNQRVTNVMTLVMALESMEVNPEATRFSLSLDRIAVSLRFAESRIDYDTAGENAESPLTALDGYFRALLAAKLEATLSDRRSAAHDVRVQSHGQADRGHPLHSGRRGGTRRPSLPAAGSGAGDDARGGVTGARTTTAVWPRPAAGAPRSVRAR
jgi:hypothetical protein